MVGIFFISGDITLKCYLWFTQLYKSKTINEASFLSNLKRSIDLCWGDVSSLAIIFILLLIDSNSFNGLILLDLAMLLLHCTRFS
jgi:hypothetical protein